MSPCPNVGKSAMRRKTIRVGVPKSTVAMILRGSTSSLAVLIPASLVHAATASIEGNVEQVVATGDGRFGGCMAALDVAPSDAGLDCAGKWVTFSCAGEHADKEDAARMFESLRAALAEEKSVEMRVTDEKKHGDYCHASRIKIQDEPHVDVDSDEDGVLDLDDDVPLDASETIDTDDDGVGNNADIDDDNDGVHDSDDAFPLDPSESVDTDGDGIGDNEDSDDDNDGIPDDNIVSFTGSRGRTLLFAYSLKEDWSPTDERGVLIYFHGNGLGTQKDMLRVFFPGVEAEAYDHGLIPVVVASPEASPKGDDAQLHRYKATPFTGRGTRGWRIEDENLIQELMQSHFGGAFRVDFDRIVFVGASQGTCFLNRFVQRFGDNYGGGLLADCGCSEGPDPLWQPPEEFRDRFRVFVRANTGDFLHTLSVQAYGYYKYIVGLTTHGDHKRAGGHCDEASEDKREVIRWLLDGTGVPDLQSEPHFRRVALMEGVVALTVDEDGSLWVATQPTTGSFATLWRSVDRGHSMEPVFRTPFKVHDLDAVGRAVILTVVDGTRSNEVSFYRSKESGKDLERLALDGGSLRRGGATTDRNQRVYVLTETGGQPHIFRSDDRGESWTSLAGPESPGFELVVDPVGGDEQESYLFMTTRNRSVEWIGSTIGNDWRRMNATPGGPLHSAAWDGTTLRGLGGHYARLYASVDRGTTWEVQELPKAASITFGFYYWPQITALRNKEFLIIGGGYDGFLLDQDGTWRHLLGGAAIGYAGATIGRGFADRRVALDPIGGDVFVSDGRGLFRIDGDIRGIDAAGTVSDSDGDAVPDALDAFPSDASEYLDTDQDGIGNMTDSDDDGDGVDDGKDGAPLDAFETVDTDGDGVGNRQDHDDDGDGVRDALDAFPLDGLEHADSDGDGIGDWADSDDDGDGMEDSLDAFPLYPHEWLDTDGDGIGDNIDDDDDNDGVPDQRDPVLNPGDAMASLEPADSFVLASDDVRWQPHEVSLDVDRPQGIAYPPAVGSRQAFGHFTLGDGPDPNIQFMIDYGDNFALAYFDRNDNGDLSDDGPPTELANRWDQRISLEVTYSSGIVVPYVVQSGGLPSVSGGLPTIEYGGAWIGEVDFDGSRVAVLTVDHDIDGIFDGPEDYVCVDIDGNRELSCQGDSPSELFRSGDTIRLKGREAQVVVAVSGHRVEIRSDQHSVPMVPSASHATRQGVVRVKNHEARAGTVEIEAFDSDGVSYGPIPLSIGARESVEFNSADLELGSPAKGLAVGVGKGAGTWRLELGSDLDIEVQGYIRTADGFRVNIDELVASEGRVHNVPLLGSVDDNRNQVSLLRLVNAGARKAAVAIEGVDDAGATSPTVLFSIPAFASRELTASDLENGVGLSSALGDGTGDWRLGLTSDSHLLVQSLLESPTGRLTNLLTTPRSPQIREASSLRRTDSTRSASPSVITRETFHDPSTNVYRVPVSTVGHD